MITQAATASAAWPCRRCRRADTAHQEPRGFTAARGVQRHFRLVGLQVDFQLVRWHHQAGHGEPALKPLAEQSAAQVEPQGTFVQGAADPAAVDDQEQQRVLSALVDLETHFPHGQCLGGGGRVDQGRQGGRGGSCCLPSSARDHDVRPVRSSAAA